MDNRHIIPFAFHLIRATLVLAVGVAAWLPVLASPVLAQSSSDGLPVRSCGQTVTTDAVLTANLACDGDGVVIGAAGVTLRLNGHTVRSTTGTGTGVLVASLPNVTWRGISILGPGTIAGFRVGQRTAFPGSKDGPNEITVRNLSLRDNNGWAASPIGEQITFDSVRISGPAGLGRYASGTVTITRSTLAVTGASIDQMGGTWSIDHSRFIGGGIVTQRRTVLTDNLFSDSDIYCSQGGVVATGNVFIDTTTELFLCEGSSFTRNQFHRTRAGGQALSLPLLYSPFYGPTRVVENTFTGWDEAIHVSGSVFELEIVGNVFWRNRAAIVQTPCGRYCTPSDATVTGNQFLRGTGDALTVASGTWHVGSNVFLDNAGHAVVAAGSGLTIIDDGGNIARRNAEPQCTGVVCNDS